MVSHGRRQSRDTGQADTVADHGRGARANEYECEGPMNSARSLGGSGWTSFSQG